ncbi:PKD domain-containing protein [Posidoniimonas corsicana]|uniref:PKD domain-containing protein n=1 Tax=Posidoniimonas corsicana TaxID=1938618 RepID=UPI0011B5DE49|nr:calcium-binding protein [Posidoniimonas corsicana]
MESRNLLTGFVESSLPLFDVLSENGQSYSVTIDGNGVISVAGEFIDPDPGISNDPVDFEVHGARFFDENGFFVRQVSGVTSGAVATTTFLEDPEADLSSPIATLMARATERGIRGDLDLAKVDSFVIAANRFGTLTLPGDALLRPFATFTATAETVVGEAVEVEASIPSVHHSGLVDREGEATLRFDFGDGTVVEQTASIQELLEFDEMASHVYSEPGSYVITVSGSVSARSSLSGDVDLRPVQATVLVRGKATVTDTPGDDEISLRNENGRLIAGVNGADQDLGASDEIGKVELRLGRGNNTVDASGLLPTQSLFVPSISNLDNETNTITGGPGPDVIFGGRGADVVFAGPGDDVITTNRGSDEAHGQAGDDTFVIPGGFNFGAAFNTDLKELLGGEGFDTLRIADLQDEMQVFAPLLTGSEFEAQLNLFKGIGSSRPEVQAFISDLEKLFIAPQSEEVNVNLPNADYFEQAEVNGSPEDDRYNFTNAQLDTVARLLDGDDEYLGGGGVDIVDGGPGDDDLNGNAGDDALTGGPGVNTLSGGAGNDRYQFDLTSGVMETTDITDSSGDADTIQFTISSDPPTSAEPITVSVDLSVGGSQQVTDDLSINLDLTLDIENVAVSSAVGGADVSGTTGNNQFAIVPQASTGGSPGTPEFVFNDGGGGDDDAFTLALDSEPLLDLDIPSTALDTTEGLIGVKSQHAPNSGDVLNYGPAAVVSVEFPDAFRAVSVDLDLQGSDQEVDVNGNTMRFESAIRHFVGSPFNDVLQIDATVNPRRVAGGAGADEVTIDAGGRPVTQTTNGDETTVEVAGYAPIVVTEFETITIINDGTPGGLTLDLTSGDDDALLSLRSITSDSAATIGRFLLTESSGAFAAEAFLQQDAISEVRSAGGADSLTIDALGQPVAVVGLEVLIADLPAIRLVDFTEVTIVNAGLPGDYNRDRRVDAADYTAWRDSLGADAGALPNDVDGGAIGQAQYSTWRANYGRVAGAEVFTLPAATVAPPAPPVDVAAMDIALAYFGGATDRTVREPAAPIEDSPIVSESDTRLLAAALDGYVMSKEVQAHNEAIDWLSRPGSEEARLEASASQGVDSPNVSPSSAFRPFTTTLPTSA